MGRDGRKSIFETISYLLPDDMKFSCRMRKATDIYNCVLNYLYGILYAKIKKVTLKCRLDPYIGIMHVDSYNKPTFVFDFMESQRYICEELAFDLCCKKEVNWEHVDQMEEGNLCFDEDARKLMVSRLIERLNQDMVYKKKHVTRERSIYLEMMEVAKTIGEENEGILVAV